jgi:hypothetical protein
VYTPTSEPSLLATSQPVISEPPRSALRVFGWLVLAAVLFGGVGALLFLALGERNAATKVADASLAPGSAGKEKVTVMLPPPEPEGSARGGSAEPTDPVPVGMGMIGSGEVAPGSDAHEDGRRDAATGQPPVIGDDKGHKRPAPRGGPVKRPAPQVASIDDKDKRQLAELIKQATALEKPGHWSEARAAWQKIQKTKGYNDVGETLYHQAWAAFQSNATNDAVRLAAASAAQTGPYKTRAMLLYGDALFRQGEVERAKNIYLGVRKSMTPDDRASAVKKIAQCNKKLGLPESDGL